MGSPKHDETPHKTSEYHPPTPAENRFIGGILIAMGVIALVVIAICKFC